MQDALSATEELSPADLSPELTKHFRGMRFWLPLQLHGLKPFRACLEEKLLLTKYFHQKIKALGFESGIEPELSVAIFRYVPPQGEADLFNKKLIDAVQRDGRIFISSTMLDGKFTLRFACLAFRTHKKQVDLLLEVIRKELEKNEEEEQKPETLENLFSYGTLQDQSVQLDTFGRLLEGRAAVLVGYRVSMIEIADKSFAASSGSAHHRIIKFTGDKSERVIGTVFKITKNELRQADDYEVAEYKRALVKLQSGEDAWAYVSAI